MDLSEKAGLMATLARARLETPRLWLRPVAPSDEAAVVAALNHIAVTGWLAVVPYPYSARDFARFQMACAVPGETFAVDDDEGFVGIIAVEDRTLGYWIAPHRHGLGYATEAALAVLAEHFTQDTSIIASGYFEGNLRSANVLRKAAGLTPAGAGLVREPGPLPKTADDLAKRIKGVPVQLTGVRPIARAISTAGGVAFGETDKNLMLKDLPGVFAAGERGRTALLGTVSPTVPSRLGFNAIILPLHP
jgi:RimJ/RimL family protein N-acetyltransferase